MNAVYWFESLGMQIKAFLLRLQHYARNRCKLAIVEFNFIYLYHPSNRFSSCYQQTSSVLTGHSAANSSENTINSPIYLNLVTLERQSYSEIMVILLHCKNDDECWWLIISGQIHQLQIAMLTYYKEVLFEKSLPSDIWQPFLPIPYPAALWQWLQSKILIYQHGSPFVALGWNDNHGFAQSCDVPLSLCTLGQM